MKTIGMFGAVLVVILTGLLGARTENLIGHPALTNAADVSHQNPPQRVIPLLSPNGKKPRRRTRNSLQSKRRVSWSLPKCVWRASGTGLE